MFLEAELMGETEMIGGDASAVCCSGGGRGVFPLMVDLRPGCCFGVRFFGDSFGLLVDWVSLLGLGEGLEFSTGFCGLTFERVSDFFLSLSSSIYPFVQ